MARGFESKSVESQFQDAEAERETRSKRRNVDAGDIELRQKREGLELSRRRIVNELAATSSDRRRESLHAALEHLNAELAKLAPSDQ